MGKRFTSIVIAAGWCLSWGCQGERGPIIRPGKGPPITVDSAESPDSTAGKREPDPRVGDSLRHGKAS